MGCSQSVCVTGFIVQYRGSGNKFGAPLKGSAQKVDTIIQRK